MIFSVVNIAVFTDKKTHLSETIQVQISVASIEVQAQMIAAGFELETTEADIEARVFPVLIEIPTAPELTKIEILTNDLEAMRANSNGLELFVTAISTAQASTSLTGTSAEIVLELVASIEALSVALYGADLANTVIQELCAQLITATNEGPSVALSVEQQAPLTASLTSIPVSVITLSLGIVKVQARRALLTGFTLPLASLDILQINLSTGEISLDLSTFIVPAALTAAEKQAELVAK